MASHLTWVLARTLSFAGRITLAKSMVQTKRTYVMQAWELLRGTCDELVKLCMNFIWGDEDNHRKVHILNWDKMRLSLRRMEGLVLNPLDKPNLLSSKKGCGISIATLILCGAPWFATSTSMVGMFRLRWILIYGEITMIGPFPRKLPPHNPLWLRSWTAWSGSRMQ